MDSARNAIRDSMILKNKLSWFFSEILPEMSPSITLKFSIKAPNSLGRFWKGFHPFDSCKGVSQHAFKVFLGIQTCEDSNTFIQETKFRYSLSNCSRVSSGSFFGFPKNLFTHCFKYSFTGVFQKIRQGFL